MRRIRRRISAIWLLSTLAFTALAVAGTIAPSAAEEGTDPAPRPGLWAASAGTSAVHLSFNTDPTVLPIAEFINLDVPYGRASWDSSGTGEALASPLWPGTAVTEGPGLLCDFAGGCPASPPGYPLTAKASTTNPDASVDGGSATAHVGPEGVRTRAGLSEAASPVTSNFGDVFTIGAIDSRTDVFFTDDGVLVSRATSRLTDVVIAGTLEIDEIVATAEARTDGDAVTEQASSVTITGASVQGQGARIGENGVEIAGNGGGGAEKDQAAQALSDALAQIGGEVRLIGTHGNAEDGSVDTSAEGLLISFEAPLAPPDGQALPTVPLPDQFPPQIPEPDPNVIFRSYVGHAIIGGATSHAFAGEGFSFDAGDLGDLGDLGGGAGFEGGGGTDGGTTTGGQDFGSSSFDSGSTSGSSTVEPPSFTTTSTTEQPTTPDEPSPTVAPERGADDTPADGGDQVQAASATDVTAQRLTSVYVLGALASAVLFLLTRLSAGLPFFSRS